MDHKAMGLSNGSQSSERASTLHFTPLKGNPALTVRTTKGLVCGGDLNGGVAFLGIPFAQPPVGSYRWAAPQAALPWDGVLHCVRFGPACPQGQVPGTGSKAIPVPDKWVEKLKPEAKPPDQLPLGMDEDCLQLNVYSPALEGKRPTMVWFHGGNLTGGASSGGVVFDPTARHGCNPCFLSQEHDLVIVTVTYRLNVFGFLNLEGGDANCGLLDAVAALRWVKEEICNFGGDPDNVTICGLSAGGHISSQLLAMPAAAGMFHKAICMSGSAQWSLGSQEEHNRRVAEPFAKRLGFPSLSDMTVEKARQLPAETLRQAYLKSRDFLESGTLNVDGSTVPRDPLDMMLEGCAKGVTVLSGVTRDEGCFSTGLKRKGASDENVVDDVKAHLQNACYIMDGDLDALRDLGENARKEVAANLVHDYQDLISRYGEAPPEVQKRCVNLGVEKCPQIANSSYELAIKALGDHDFMISHLMAVWALSQHNKVYAYVFSEESVPGTRFAGHGADQPFLFGTQGKPGDSNSAGAAHLSSLIMEAWAAFAKTGNPSTPNLGEWPALQFPAAPDGYEALPAAPLGMEHMNFEHNRTGLVSYGWEETRIWFKHALRLASLNASAGGSAGLRPSVKSMASCLYPDLGSS